METLFFMREGLKGLLRIVVKEMEQVVSETECRHHIWMVQVLMSIPTITTQESTFSAPAIRLTQGGHKRNNWTGQ
jgi:hypothetical protein